MKTALPATGTSELLGLLSPHIPDEFINEQWPCGPTGGRRRAFSAAQLWRTHLLLLLTPAPSINLLVELLKEQRAWRGFAHLPHRERVPDVRMLHEFRARMGTSGLRRINERLVKPLLGPLVERADSIALIDATDLPAACRGFKKRPPARIPPSMRPSVTVRLKRVRIVGLSVTKNIRCGFGLLPMRRRCC